MNKSKTLARASSKWDHEVTMSTKQTLNACLLELARGRANRHGARWPWWAFTVVALLSRLDPQILLQVIRGS